METKLLFMTSRVRPHPLLSPTPLPDPPVTSDLCPQVRFGQQKRYQDWFQRQYLSTAESQSLRCDLIRYICGVVHPSNEVLSSDILPRWAIIGWLLTTCTVRRRSLAPPGRRRRSDAHRCFCASSRTSLPRTPNWPCSTTGCSSTQRRTAS